MTVPWSTALKLTTSLLSVQFHKLHIILRIIHNLNVEWTQIATELQILTLFCGWFHLFPLSLFLAIMTFCRSFENQYFAFLVSRDEGEALKINDWNSAIQVNCQHVKKQIETGKELSENLCSVGCFSLRNICSWILHFQPGLHWVIRAWHHGLFWIGRATSKKMTLQRIKVLVLTLLILKIQWKILSIIFLSILLRPKPCLGDHAHWLQKDYVSHMLSSYFAI